MKPATLIAIVIFSLVSLLHLVRVIYRLDFMIGDKLIPMWVSVLGCIIPAGVAFELWRESKK